MMNNPMPLSGTKVLELGTWIALPSSAAILGDWGADVIKVENMKGGDPLRGFKKFETMEMGDVNFWWELDNRNKKGIALNLDHDNGKQILLELAEKTDVFLTNMSPKTLKKRGIDYEAMRSINPGIVYVNLTGFGEKGPDSERPGFDIVAFWTRSGFMHALGDLNEVPPMQPKALGDKITSLTIAGAACAGLLARQRTGEGQQISLSLYQVGAWALSYDIQAALFTSKEAPPRNDRKRVMNPLWNLYKTKDQKWIQLACLQSDPYWHPFCQAASLQELEFDPRFSSHSKREENKEALIAILDETFSAKTVQEWSEILRRHNIIYQEAYSFLDIVNDPQAAANQFFTKVDHPSTGQITLVNSPVTFGKTATSARICAPELGQHSEEILLELGFSWEDIVKLKDEGAVI